MEQSVATTKKKMVLVDFDDTLITCDSMVTILKEEGWYWDAALWIAGVKIVLAKVFRGDVYAARSAFKYILMQKYEKLSNEKREHYFVLLKKRLNSVVIDGIQQIEADKIVVASASVRELIEQVLDGVLKVDVVVANERADYGSYSADTVGCKKQSAVIANEKAGFRTCYGVEKARRFCKAVPDYREYDIYVFSDSYSDQPIFELGFKNYLVKDGLVEEI